LRQESQFMRNQSFIYRSSIIILTFNHLGESLAERDALCCFNAEWKMTDSGGKNLRELEFNDLNINFYRTLYYSMASYIL